tara:strand:+ start:552 stop:1250 length:699 start_codon:yes stop_codon:yes gene_type:complete
MKKILAITLARAGSKRIKKKNIKQFNGKPLISHTIKAALESKKINRYIVSTDSKEIAKISKFYGAEIPFMRPIELAKDNTSDFLALKHALEQMNNIYNYQPDIIVNLRATSPFRNGRIIDRAINKFLSSKADLLRTVSKVEGVHHPYWMYKINKNDYANQFVKKININAYYQSQKLPDIYRLNGLVDIYKRESIYKNKILNGKMITLVTSDSISHDIDTISDFKFAESLTKK